ncbi:MAG: cellulose biosynthesis cyclic di-GMP-binding regulatory protein BcsB [Legionella longbeachae]|nr:cellulose biosynthesis cyclic di-GMP-binding regulatory protein BcsB [Legionella longbeachae]
MISKIIRITVSILGGVSLLAAPMTFAQPTNAGVSAETPVLSNSSAETSVLSNSSAVPSRTVKLYFKNIRQQKNNFNFGNYGKGEQIEFSIRKDELVNKAFLHLEFIPSPALIPILSQLKIYLNDELVNVMTIKEEQLGKLSSADILIDPHFINDFNRLRLELIGHYKAICENPGHSSIWINIDKSSYLELTVKNLLLKNDLSHFPEPFFDSLDNNPVNLPMIFAGQPNLIQQRAAAILASWFGSKALWRGVSFSVLYNELPMHNAIVLATNEQRPDFLKNYKTVNAPTVEMISHPDNPYIKFLLIMGRDDKDLITAVQGIAQGNILFRGQSVIIENVKKLKPRQPYDAPNWIRTDRPVTFEQLQEFKGQLQAKGFTLYPILLRFNLPPDLYLNKNRGIELNLKYRYSLAPRASLSHLDITLNDSFINSYALQSYHGDETLFSSDTLSETNQKLYIPVAKPGIHNLLAFDFQYGIQFSGGVQSQECTTYGLINNFGVIDSASSIDFSNYSHHITMPNLSAFVDSGFPFSRLADLSETIVYIDSQSKPKAISTLLNVIGTIGSQTGYPALGMTLKDDWAQVKNKDADLLIIGVLPEELRQNANINLLLNKTQNWIKEPLNQNAMPSLQLMTPTAVAESKTTIHAMGAMAGILGIQSPNFTKRSIIILRAEDQQDFELLNKAITDQDNRYKIFGSVTVIRDSGIESLRVGPVYNLGNLSWWRNFWVALQQHPVNLALISLLAAVIVTFLLWRGLLAMSQRRLKGQGDKE